MQAIAQVNLLRAIAVAFVGWLASQLVNRVLAKFFKRPLDVAEEKATEAAEALHLA